MTQIIKRTSLAFTILFVVVILGVGCGGKTDESNSEEVVTEAPSGTIAFTTKDPEKGLLSGTFEYDGYAIQFDVVRGEEMESWYQTDGGLTHSIDARLCDERRYCFFEQAGGHSFADPDWIPEGEIDAPTSDQVLKNNRTTWMLHRYLVWMNNEKELDGLREEYQTLLDISNMPPEEWGIPIMDIQKEKELNLETPQKGVSALIASSASSYTAEFEIWWQYVVFAKLQVGEHTSTRTRIHDSTWLVTKQLVTCNHGSCAAASGMSFFCRREFSNRSNSIPFNTKCDVPATSGTMHPSGYDGCCSTQYKLTGVSHVCNDDTRLQRDFMIAGAPMSTPYCGDTALARYAPSCQ